MSDPVDPGSEPAEPSDDNRSNSPLLEAVGDGIYRADDDGRLVESNDAFASLVGTTSERLRGTDLSTLFGETDRERIEAASVGIGGTLVSAGLETEDGTVPCEVHPTPTADGHVGVVREVSGADRASMDADLTPPDSITDVIDEADIGVFVLDENHRVVWADSTVNRYFGLDPERLIGRDKREVVEKQMAERVDDGEEFVETMLAAYDDDDGLEEFEWHVTAGDGREERWVEQHSKPITSGQYAGGRVELYYDITDRKRSEGSLRDAEEQFRSLVDAVGEYAIFRLDPDGRIVSWNEGAREIKGYESAEVLGESIERFYTEADREAGVPEQNLERATRQGSIEEEGWRVRKDGSRFWANVTITAVRDDDGTHRGYLKVTRDMTDRHRRKRELETELERITGRISDAFYAVDESFRFTHVNERAEQLLGYSRGELEGTAMWRVLPDATELYEEFQHALSSQEPASFEHYFEPLGIWAEVNVYPSETGLSVYLLDVTERKERERELRKSEQRYRTMAEQFPNGIVTLFDDEKRYELAAGQAFERLDVSDEEVEGARLHDVWPPDTVAELEPAFDAALRGEERSVELEYAGREWVVRVVPIADERGEVFAGMTMAQDITERKERERYLEDVKSRLEAATEAGAVGTWEWNVPDDEMIVSESFARTYDVDPERAREGVSIDNFLEAIHEDDRERVQHEIERAVETGGEVHLEYRVENADGEYRWVVARGHVEYEDGEPVRFPGALTDITERKRAELELRRSNEQLEALFEVLPVGVVVADTDAQIRSANDTAGELLGIDISGVEGLRPDGEYEVYWADSGEHVATTETTLSRVIDGETVTEPDVFEVVAADGTRRTLEIEGRPIFEDGEVARGVVTMSDVTERREYERKLKESNERLEQFAYSASHDLQEPLRMVSSYLQLIENRYDDVLDDDGREFLDYAVDGAERMKAMIDGLLAYSRVETRGNPLEPTDLGSVLADVRTDLQLRIEESGAAITTDPLPTVAGDEGQLRQVLQNLVENAIDYSGEDRPEIHVAAERCGDQWRIDVIDEGIGIDPDDQDRIFEVFQRLHARNANQGTGIGLSLVERIVERHGGEIWVESEPGEGATFSFTLPAVDDGDDA
ncbi:PAS domain S-box protein [Halolamina litorea]|uniref:histidine kinase n=1 Tax=Halolamina litorea TaxID=1515593 RepID=A0ABD6BRX1_9EURY|nr:PAS domain S-box protein [Halolamina litorea]